jgi:anti-sigma B factor antagonist
MNLRVDTEPAEVRILPSGDIDHEGAEKLKAAVATLSLQGKTAVIFDFRDVRHIGSAGLGKLLLFYKRLSVEKIEMRIESASPALLSLLRELRLDTLFTIR